MGCLVDGWRVAGRLAQQKPPSSHVYCFGHELLRHRRVWSIKCQSLAVDRKCATGPLNPSTIVYFLFDLNVLVLLEKNNKKRTTARPLFVAKELHMCRKMRKTYV